jgi:hypothetical protein
MAQSPYQTLRVKDWFGMVPSAAPLQADQRGEQLYKNIEVSDDNQNVVSKIVKTTPPIPLL